MSYRALTSVQVSQFRSDGFISIQNGLTHQDLDQLRVCVKTILADPSRYTRTKKDSAQVFRSNLELGWLGWRNSTFADWIHRCATHLIGADVAIWFSQVLISPKTHGAGSPWHQDAAYGAQYDTPGSISCWIPLQRVDVTSGCMHFEKGGHQKGIIAQDPIHAHHAEAFPPPDQDQVVACPMNCQSVLFHHARAPHMTRPNTSKRDRCTVIVRFTHPDYTPVRPDALH